MIEVKAVIAGGGDHQGVFAGEVHGFIKRRDQWSRAGVPSASGECGAETHIDDVSARAAFRQRGRSVEKGRNDRAERPRTVVQRFHAYDGRFGRDADGSDPIVRRRDNPGDVSAMPESPDVLVEGEARNEGPGGGDVYVAGQIQMRAVNSAVNDRHAYAGAVDARGPGAGRFDRLDVPLRVDECLVARRDGGFNHRRVLNRLLPYDNLIGGGVGELL